jgi:chorismate mutase
MQRLFALRGAINVEHNDAQDILDATTELMQAVMARNSLSPQSVVSCIFTATNENVPLLCAREIPVPRSMPRVIRVLIHYYAEEDHEPVHVYLGDARALRADLHAAQ